MSEEAKSIERVNELLAVTQSCFASRVLGTAPLPLSCADALALLLVVASLVLAMGAGPWVAGTPIALQLHGDHSFVLARSFGIMVMHGGFALLEAGSVHIANRGNIMMKNLADMSFCMVFFLLYGYSLGLAEGNSFIGGSGSVGLRNADAIEYTAFFYHFSFATTTGTIVSGAVAGRMPFKTYIFLSALVTSIVCAPVCGSNAGA